MPRTTDLISVIVPVYNTRPYLHRCMDSILNQSYPHIEVLIVDDGSTDGSGDEIEALIEGNAKCRLYRQPHQGAGAARNLGLAQAGGEYIAFVDSDDYVAPDYLQAMYRQMQHDGARLCSCPMNIVDARRRGRSRIVHDQPPANWREAVMYFYSACNHLFHRSLIANTRFPDDGIGEDTVFMVDTLLNSRGERRAFVDRPLYHYCQREGSTMRGDRDFTRRYANVSYLRQLLDRHGVYAELKAHYSFMVADRLLDDAFFIMMRQRAPSTALRMLRRVNRHYGLPKPELRRVFQSRGGHIGMLVRLIAYTVYRWPGASTILQPPLHFLVRIYRLLFKRTQRYEPDSPPPDITV